MYQLKAMIIAIELFAMLAFPTETIQRRQNVAVRRSHRAVQRQHRAVWFTSDTQSKLEGTVRR